MIFIIAAGLLLLGFTGWSMHKSAQKSKQPSKCAGCAIANSCPVASGAEKPSALTLKNT